MQWLLTMTVFYYGSLAMPQHQQRTVFVWMAGWVGVMILLNNLAVAVVVQGFRKLQALLDAGTPPANLPAAAVLAAMRPYRLPVVISGLGWFVPTLVLPAFLEAKGLEPTAAEIDVIRVGGLCLCACASVMNFYQWYMLVMGRVAPVVLPHGGLDHLKPFKYWRVWMHLGMLVLLTTVLGPIALVSLASSGGQQVAWVAATMVLLTGVVQVAAIIRSITIPLGHLAGRMSMVRTGNLDVTAQVFNLDTLGLVASDFNSMVEGLRQRAFLRDTFGRYVAHEVAEHILAGRVALGGETRFATVLFSDIRGFTRMSENMSPEEVVAFLNRYLELMVDCVVRHRGLLDKFIGDAVMAVFGVPVSHGTPAEDARAAVACAMEMEEALQRFNQERLEAGQPAIDIGIGVHSGEVVAGNIGHPQRMQYTVIGDTVNLASRLEGMTKELGRRILLSQTTAELIGEGFDVEQLQTLSVRGRAQTVQVYGLRQLKDAQKL